MSLFGRTATSRSPQPLRLHVGCGETPIPGWINIDLKSLPGVERVIDVRDGLPFRRVASIFAEHFLEHLSLEEGLAFLRECRRVLADDGVLRISTPNLDWVMLTHYHYGHWASAEESLLDCVQTNRAFHGWGHRFLYNPQMLTAALRSAGFADVSFHSYGESERPELRGLERHVKSPDSPELPHMAIVEAVGVAPPSPLPESVWRPHREGAEAG